MAKQADAMGLNPIPDQRGIGSTPVPETTHYRFIVQSTKFKGLVRTQCFKRPFEVKEPDLLVAWKMVDDMLWAEDMKNTKHEIVHVVVIDA